MTLRRPAIYISMLFTAFVLHHSGAQAADPAAATGKPVSVTDQKKTSTSGLDKTGKAASENPEDVEYDKNGKKLTKEEIQMRRINQLAQTVRSVQGIHNMPHAVSVPVIPKVPAPVPRPPRRSY